MAPVNPYLRKKPSKKAPDVSSSVPLSAPPSTTTHATATAKSHVMAATKLTKATSVVAPKHRPSSSSTIQQRPLALPPSVPKSARPSVAPQPAAAISNQKTSSKGIIQPTPVFSSLKNKSMSFKSKLKQEIESLKRAKQLEKQRKLQEKQAKQLKEQRGEQQQKQEQLTEQQQVHNRQRLLAEARVYHDLLRGGGILKRDIPSHVQHLIPGYQLTTSTMNAQATTNYVTPAKTASANVQQMQSSQSRLLSVQQVTPATVPAASNHSPSTQSNVDNSVAPVPNSNGSSGIPAAATLNAQSTQNLPVPPKTGGAIVNVGNTKVTKSVEARLVAKDERPLAPNTKSPADVVVPMTMVLTDRDNAVEAFSAVPPVKTESLAPMEGYGLASQHNLAFNQMYPPFADERLNFMCHQNGAALFNAQYTRMPTGSVPPYGWNPYPYHPYPIQMNPTWMQSPAPPQTLSTRALAPTPRATSIPKPKTCILHHEPLNPVSPYSTTHDLLKGEIVIFKKAGESFGVSFQFESQSTLVEPDTADKMSVELVSNTKSVKLQTTMENESSDLVDSKVMANVGTTRAAKKSSIDATLKENGPAPNIQNTVMKTNLSKDSSTPSPDIATGAAKQPEKQRRPRRRRVFFGVLKVVHADKQNDQFKTERSNGMILKPGDIILKVNGREVGGLTFPQAIALFASCDTTSDQAASTMNSSESNQSLIRCPLVVARMKVGPSLHVKSAQVVSHESHVHGQSLPVPSMRIPFVLNTITNQVQSGDFSNTEILALAQGALRCISAASRALGNLPSPNLELACLQSPALNQRDISSITAKQNHAFRSIEQSLKELATAHWTNQWKIEQEKAGVSGLQLAHLSDAQRSAMRALPRPAKGCRCGRMDHGHVNDSNCVLYRNLRVLTETKSSPDTRKETRKAKSGNLNAVETAYKDRILKLKAETEREEEEARFVEEMEELQVKQLKVAVFAPTLTAMVLSAVAEVAKDISKDDSIDKGRRDTMTLDGNKLETQSGVSLESPKNHVGAAIKSSSAQTPKDSLNVADDADESDEDDDVPLVSLCKKRDAPSTQEPDSKRPKVQAGTSTAENTIDKNPYAMKERPSLSLSFLARILRHCSQTWGHLYKEPNDAEYAWRWEVFHGQTSSAADAYRDSKRRNPRLVDALSLENIRFALIDDDVISRLSAATTPNGAGLKSDASSLEASNDMLTLSWLLSPKSSGVYDEIMALMTMGVLRRTISGCVVLAKDWDLHVDPLLLNDMEEHWCKRLDPRNKHCISRSVRAQLESEWTRVRSGWALSSDLDDIIYPDDEWNEWKAHFQDRFESQINDAEGIERFGI